MVYNYRITSRNLESEKFMLRATADHVIKSYQLRGWYLIHMQKVNNINVI